MQYHSLYPTDMISGVLSEICLCTLENLYLNYFSILENGTLHG